MCGGESSHKELLRERELREEAEAIAAEQQQMTAKAAALASHEGFIALQFWTTTKQFFNDTPSE